MPDRFQESHIRQVPIFSQLPAQQFQWIVQAFQARRYNAGDRVLIQSTDVPGLIIVAEGQLREVQVAHDGTIVKDGAVYAGQPIYEKAMFTPLSAEAHLQAIVPTTILLLSRDAMGDLLSHHPELRMPFGLSKSSKDHHKHDVHFITQRENEEVLYYEPRHWMSMMRWMWVAVALMIGSLVLSPVTALPILLVVIALTVFIIAQDDSLKILRPEIWLWIALAIFIFGVPMFFLSPAVTVILTGIAYMIYVIAEWSNDVVIVTDQRVIRIAHTSLLFRKVQDEVPIESVQEANAEIPTFDLFARALDYGDVELKTAGAQGNFMLGLMPHPEALSKLVLDDAERARSRKQTISYEQRVAEVDRWLEGKPKGANVQVDKSKNAEQTAKSYEAGKGPASPFVTSFIAEDGTTVYRKHWFIWLRAIAFPVVWTLACLVLIVVSLVAPIANIGLIGAVGGFVGVLAGVAWAYLADWDWRHDYYQITDENIKIVNQRPFWLQDETEQILLRQVDNVVAESSGIFQYMFKFGDVKVALVGANEPKLFDNVGKPQDVQSEITRRQQRMKQRQAAEEERIQRETIGEYISIYNHRQNENDDELAAEMYQRGAQEQANMPPQYQYPPANNPAAPQAPASRPAQSPFGNQRPSISSGRPYMPTSQPPPQQYPAAYQPDQQQYPQQGQQQYPQQGQQQYPQQGQQQYPQQGQQQYPQQGQQQYPQQGQQQYPQQGQQQQQQGQQQYPQQGQQQYPQQGQQQYPQQEQNPPPPPDTPYSQGQNPPPPPNVPYQQQRPSNQRPPGPPPFRSNPNN